MANTILKSDVQGSTRNVSVYITNGISTDTVSMKVILTETYPVESGDFNVNISGANTGIYKAEGS